MITNMKITRVCEFCNNEVTARTTKTRYYYLTCNSKGYKSLARQSKITQSNKQTEIAKNPEIELVKTKDFLSVSEVSLLFGISRRTIYRIISRGELDVTKFGTRKVIRGCEIDTFFSIPLDQSILRLTQELPGLENCYTITQIQFAISSGTLYMLIQRQSKV
jgi:excisionase family DNA binding protein